MSRFGKTSQYFADEEIILSAGAVGSPQILMLSGVGDRDHLDELGIRIIHHSPQVGQNLQDHLIVPLAFDTPEPLGLDILCQATYGNFHMFGCFFLKASLRFKCKIVKRFKCMRF